MKHSDKVKTDVPMFTIDIPLKYLDIAGIAVHMGQDHLSIYLSSEQNEEYNDLVQAIPSSMGAEDQSELQEAIHTAYTNITLKRVFIKASKMREIK